MSLQQVQTVVLVALAILNIVYLVGRWTKEAESSNSQLAKDITKMAADLDAARTRWHQTTGSVTAMPQTMRAFFVPVEVYATERDEAERDRERLQKHCDRNQAETDRLWSEFRKRRDSRG